MTFVPEIIFSNNDVVVVNKPYGMLVHEDWHSRVEGTLVEWFLEIILKQRGGEEALKPDGTPSSVPV